MAEEKTFENKVKKYLKEKNIWHVKYFANTFTKVGVPDILACVNGKFLAIELKAEKGKVSELQEYNIDKIKESGGIAIVLRPSKFEEFKKLIEVLENDYIV